MGFHPQRKSIIFYHSLQPINYKQISDKLFNNRWYISHLYINCRKTHSNKIPVLKHERTAYTYMYGWKTRSWMISYVVYITSYIGFFFLFRWLHIVATCPVYLYFARECVCIILLGWIIHVRHLHGMHKLRPFITILRSDAAGLASAHWCVLFVFLLSCFFILYVYTHIYISII